MKHFRLLFILILILLTACSSANDASLVPTVSAGGTTTETHVASRNIRANGILLPTQQMAVSFGVGGFIEAVKVGLGESVRAGQILVSLDTTEAELALKQGKAELAAAQANYDLIAVGRPAERQAAISVAHL